MTPQEARIARLTARLVAEHGLDLIDMTIDQLMGTVSKFIDKYDPNMPCAYHLECVQTGRCPREIVCNN